MGLIYASNLSAILQESLLFLVVCSFVRFAVEPQRGGQAVSRAVTVLPASGRQGTPGTKPPKQSEPRQGWQEKLTSDLNA